MLVYCKTVVSTRDDNDTIHQQLTGVKDPFGRVSNGRINVLQWDRKVDQIQIHVV